MAGKTINRKLRTQILKRDNNQCCKCGRVEGMEVHHIISRLNNGTDVEDNLITLCDPCHQEWHSLENRSTLPFRKWLEIPPLDILIYAYMTECPEETSASNLKEYTEEIQKSLKQKSFPNTNTTSSIAFLSMLGTFTKFERNTIHERTLGGRKQKARRGGYASGSPALGYVAEDKQLFVNDLESVIVKDIFLMHSEGIGLRAIAAELNKSKIKTKRGGQWYASTVKYILENSKYSTLR